MLEKTTPMDILYYKYILNSAWSFFSFTTIYFYFFRVNVSGTIELVVWVDEVRTFCHACTTPAVY